METVSVSLRSKILRELLRLSQGTDVIVQSSDGAQFFLTRIMNADTSTSIKARMILMLKLSPRAKTRG